MDKTCKSSAAYCVAIHGKRSGARVRNTWVIYHEVGDNSLKGELIPNVDLGWHRSRSKVGDRKA